MREDLRFALHLADLASAVTRKAFGSRLPIELKHDATPVTVVDSQTETVIRDEIAATFPDDAVLGEEGGLAPGSSGRTWVVDPIDGTRMFAEGIPLWTTLIGLKDDSGLLAGVADAPVLGERYYAERGGGAFCNGRPINVSDVTALDDALVLHAPLEEFARSTGHDALVRLTTRTRVSRGIGDAWAQLLVARGAADALVEQGPCFEWDWAATSLIVAEAGGHLSRLEGGDPVPGCHLLVTNGQLDPTIRAALYPDLPDSQPTTETAS
jgi:histidinol phosphatase-like enzyme (inositol monophosphatase family)